ncbi:RusA family crossover junction endodeoxyribonuclease [Winogradskyella thalassocola]|uniref:Holliday junction resolvase RusA (Prophage-encoded endonuclease) n=1 Tax=Winogradskyella thalassocola TaxID=262004 RepID=A0A1G8MC68_9FLAO|nr:RusA family crossover junction endodeoxyribonuclease [Winogradskyella thalassocola]SDI65467.1 Holliday junction resolvase RusA (prophage-encoded endonuclease) [Winogradskyella thalassocola]
MTGKYVTFRQNPKVEILFGFYGGKPIPTKQDKFKPLKAFEIDEDGNEVELKNFYERKDDKNSIQEMKELVSEYATEAFKEKGIIKRPANIEVLLSFSVKERRFKEVDIDNLTKTILDGLTGVAFEDDSQVSSLIVNKHVHEMKIDALFIGVTELTDENKGFGNDIKLFGEVESE